MHSLLESTLHQIPTLWSLYRPLLFATSSLPLPLNQRQILHSYIRDNFKRNRKFGNIEKIKRKWIQAEQASSFSFSLFFASQADHSLADSAIASIRIKSQFIVASLTNERTSFPPPSHPFSSLSSSSSSQSQASLPSSSS